jgi:hypothetical protein
MTEQIEKYQSFNTDGLELVVNTSTGEAYASKRAAARMLGVDHTTVLNYKGGDKNDQKTARISTSGGFQVVHLLSSSDIAKLAIKYNSALALKMLEAGANLYICGLAGYKVNLVEKEFPTKSPIDLQIESHEAMIRELILQKNIEESNSNRTRTAVEELNKQLAIFDPTYHDLSYWVDIMELDMTGLSWDAFIKNVSKEYQGEHHKRAKSVKNKNKKVLLSYQEKDKRHIQNAYDSMVKVAEQDKKILRQRYLNLQAKIQKQTDLIYQAEHFYDQK